MANILGSMPTPFPPIWASTWGTNRRVCFFAELELAQGVVTHLRWIPPGRFLMGTPGDEAWRNIDEESQHWVTLSRGFWLADAPCTQAEWRAVMETEPSEFKGGDLPVERVSWEDCQEFCKRLRLRFPGFEARLPTEAEWEYACRAGTTSAFNDGSACTEPEGRDLVLDKLGWFDKNSGRKTHPVRQKEPNRWGLYDMHGNVMEWCEDWYDPYTADDQVDPAGSVSGHARVCRGGSRGSLVGDCRSAGRSGGFRYHTCGFRLASGQVSQVEKPAGEEQLESERV